MEMDSDAILRVVFLPRGNATDSPIVEIFQMKNIAAIAVIINFIVEIIFALIKKIFVMVSETAPTEGMKDNAVNYFVIN